MVSVRSQQLSIRNVDFVLLHRIRVFSFEIFNFSFSRALIIARRDVLIRPSYCKSFRLIPFVVADASNTIWNFPDLFLLSISISFWIFELTSFIQIIINLIPINQTEIFSSLHFSFYIHLICIVCNSSTIRIFFLMDFYSLKLVLNFVVPY